MSLSAAALCLASVIYAEARGEPIDGQIAVGQVVMNRVSEKHWPSDICEVAYQKHQFANLTPDEKTIDLAVQILNGEFDDFTDGATHFYSGTKTPWWAPKMRYVGQIAGHRFLEEQRT